MARSFLAIRGFGPAALLAGLACTASLVAAQPAGNFTATGSMQSPRVRHTATLLTNAKVLVVGGIPNPVPTENGSLSSAELYDNATGSFSAAGSMSMPRASHTATLLPDGRVLIAGGHAGIVDQKVLPATSTAELYDPTRADL